MDFPSNYVFCRRNRVKRKKVCNAFCLNQNFPKLLVRYLSIIGYFYTSIIIFFLYLILKIWWVIFTYYDRFNIIKINFVKIFEWLIFLLLNYMYNETRQTYTPCLGQKYGILIILVTLCIYLQFNFTSSPFFDTGEVDCAETVFLRAIGQKNWIKCFL